MNINVNPTEINGGVSVQIPGNNMQSDYYLSGIIVGSNDNPANYTNLKAQNPYLEIIPPKIGVYAQNPNMNINMNIPNADFNAQNPNMNMSNDGLNVQNPQINDPNVNLQGPNINTNIQPPNLNIPQSNFGINTQLPNMGVTNERGEFILSGIM